VTAVAETTGAGWGASLELCFAADATGATRLDRRAHRGPFLVQRPFFPEGREVCHVYLLHPPGGLVGGDELRLDLRVGEGARALVTTPAAGKAYRTLGAVARQTQNLTVASGASLEWLPQETILYDGAAVEIATTVELAPEARFFGAETLCFGLPARREPFARGWCRQSFELRRRVDGAGLRPAESSAGEGENPPRVPAVDLREPLLVERGRFDGGAPVHAAPWGLGGATVLTLIVAAPAPGPGALEQIAGLKDPADRAGASIVADGGVLVVRHLTGVAERARGFVQAVWAALRPALLDRSPVAPRIWFT
jgi:urease accessory protein